MTQDVTNAPNRATEAEAGEASDIEQRVGHGGNMRDGGAGIDMPPARPSDPIGGSGHIPRLDEIRPSSTHEISGSPGADADRRGAESY